MFFSFSSSAKGQTTQTTPLIETRLEQTREFQRQLIHYFSKSDYKSNHHQHVFLFSISKLHVTSSQVCLYLLDIYHFTYTFSHAHTDAHTQAHMYNQHTRGMVTTRHRSLVERGGRKALLETLQTHKNKNMFKTTDIHDFKEKIRAHRASSKATRLFFTK